MTLDGWRDKLLRPGATTFAAGLHALVLMGVALPHPPLAGADDNIEIAITQAGDAAAEAPKQPSEDNIAQSEAHAAQMPKEKTEEAKLEKPPEPEPQEVLDKPVEVAAEAPKREVEDAETIARSLEEIKEKKRERRKRLAAQAAEAQQEHRANSSAEGGANRASMSRATYAHRVLAEIRRHQLHPPRSGEVRVAFSIGGGGGVSASLASSSGDGMLDSMALRILRSCHPGPPPGGQFSGTVAIRFN
jgi:TonB family protein